MLMATVMTKSIRGIRMMVIMALMIRLWAGQRGRPPPSWQWCCKKRDKENEMNLTMFRWSEWIWWIWLILSCWIDSTSEQSKESNKSDVNADDHDNEGSGVNDDNVPDTTAGAADGIEIWIPEVCVWWRQRHKNVANVGNCGWLGSCNLPDLYIWMKSTNSNYMHLFKTIPSFWPFTCRRHIAYKPLQFLFAPTHRLDAKAFRPVRKRFANGIWVMAVCKHQASPWILG